MDKVLREKLLRFEARCGGKKEAADALALANVQQWYKFASGEREVPAYYLRSMDALLELSNAGFKRVCGFAPASR